MDFGKLFARSWDILWKNPYLILLGALAALDGTGSRGSIQPRYLLQGSHFDLQNLPRFDSGWPLRGLDLPSIAMGGVLLIILLILLVGIIFWALGTIARGGLINAVDDLESGRPSNFPTAFQAAWEKGWELLGISVILVLPALVLVALGFAAWALSGGWGAMGEVSSLSGWRAIYPLLGLACLLVPLGLALSLLRTFASRACMLEGTGVLASYRRAVEVLGKNLGSAALLFLLQIALTIAVGVMMIVPGFLSAVCCLLWPLLILVQAFFAAFYSALWTLAWREWVPA